MWSSSYCCFSTGMRDDCVKRLTDGSIDIVSMMAGKAIRPLSAMQRVGYSYK